ncbi:MAG TPA: hypothetical protein VF595_02820 [Tepidisphaeraceae bacterium]|jgi:hypothetical protein
MSGILAYVPFLTPLPVWDYWVWLIIPLCASVSVVYKTIKCRYVRQIPREALSITIWILLSMAGVAVGLQVLYWLMVEWN